MLRLHAGSSQTMVRSVVRTKVSEKEGYPIRMRTYVAPKFVTNFAQMLDLGSNLRTNMHPACRPPPAPTHVDLRIGGTVELGLTRHPRRSSLLVFPHNSSSEISIVVKQSVPITKSTV